MRRCRRNKWNGTPGEAEDGWSPAVVMAAWVPAPIASLREAREVVLHSADRFDAAAALVALRRQAGRDHDPEVAALGRGVEGGEVR